MANLLNAQRFLDHADTSLSAHWDYGLQFGLLEFMSITLEDTYYYYGRL